jgi:hypothetical protein
MICYFSLQTDMDNASFLASLAPDLRQEILLTADDAFITSLPPTLIAEANVLRERVAAQHRRRTEDANNAAAVPRARASAPRQAQPSEGGSRGRRQRNGVLRVEADRKEMVFVPERMNKLGPLLTPHSAKAFFSLFYLLLPVQPQRIIHSEFDLIAEYFPCCVIHLVYLTIIILLLELMLNMCLCESAREPLLNALFGLLNNDKKSVLELLDKLDSDQKDADVDQSGGPFPPSSLIGVTAELVSTDSNSRMGVFRRRQQVGNATATTVAASLPASARGSYHDGKSIVIPVVARRMISLASSLCKSSPRMAFSMLCNAEGAPSCLDGLLDLIHTEQYSQSATSLEQLLSLMEMVVAPLSLLPKEDSATAELQSNQVKVPRVVVSKQR